MSETLWSDMEIYEEATRVASIHVTPSDDYDALATDIEQSLYNVRDAMQARITELESQIAAAQQWQQGLAVNEYQISADDPYLHQVTIKRRVQETGADKWAIYRGSAVLSKDGDFDWEPLPSSRDKEFTSRFRFDTPAEALACYQRTTPQEPPVELRSAQQWQPMPTPDWSQAPADRTQWWAIDPDGQQVWGEGKGEAVNGRWRSADSYIARRGFVDLPLGIDWRTTLQQRTTTQEAA